MIWIAIGAGGAIGAMSRHALNHVAHAYWFSSKFPAGTLIVNLVGCFVIGLLAGLLASNRIALRFHWREFVFVGILGGFTTFSTFGLDTFVLARTQSVAQAALNVAAHVGGGLLAVWLGYQIGTFGR